MKWIRRILGMNELIEKQNKTNELLKEIIRLQKHGINNDCRTHERKREVY